MPDDLTTIAAVILSVVVPAVAAYFFGVRQAEQERIIEERARVISRLFKLYVDLDDQVHSLVKVYERAGEQPREAKYRRAAESFNKLLAYHRRNSIWVSRPTARYVDRFIERYRESLEPFEEEQGYAKASRWLEVWKRFEKESPKLRLALEEEFRRALGERWVGREAWQRRLSELESPDKPAPETSGRREDGF